MLLNKKLQRGRMTIGGVNWRGVKSRPFPFVSVRYPCRDAVIRCYPAAVTVLKPWAI